MKKSSEKKAKKSEEEKKIDLPSAVGFKMRNFI